MRSIQVIGICHPAGEKEDFDGFRLKQSEIEKKCKDLINLDVLDEHDPTKVIGKVKDAFVDKDSNEMMVSLDIFNDTLEGSKICTRLVNKKIKHLSLGLNHFGTDNPKRVLGHDILHVALVDDPGLEGTDITYVQPRSAKFKETKQKIELLAADTNSKKEIYKTEEGCELLQNREPIANTKKAMQENAPVKEEPKTPTIEQKIDEYLNPKTSTQKQTQNTISEESKGSLVETGAAAKTMPNNTPNQAGNAQAPPAAAPATTPVPSAEGQDAGDTMTKVAKMSKKELLGMFAQMHNESQDNKKRKAELEEQSKALKLHQQHLPMIKKMLEKQEEENKKFIDEVNANTEAHLDLVTQEFIEAGQEPDQRFLENYKKTLAEDPMQAQPVWNVITVAHANKQRSIKRGEKIYEKAKADEEEKTAEIAELKSRLRNQEREAEGMKAQFNKEYQINNYANDMSYAGNPNVRSQAPSNPGNQTKSTWNQRWQAEQAQQQPQQQTGGAQLASEFPPSSNPPPKPNSAAFAGFVSTAPTRGTSLQTWNNPDSQNVFAMFGGSRELPHGIENMDYSSIKGKDFFSTNLTDKTLPDNMDASTKIAASSVPKAY